MVRARRFLLDCFFYVLILCHKNDCVIEPRISIAASVPNSLSPTYLALNLVVIFVIDSFVMPGSYFPSLGTC